MGKYLWLALSAAAKIIYGIVLYKLVSSTFGVEKLGLLGQLLSLLSLSIVLSNCGIGRGIIQALAAQKGDSLATKATLSAIKRINLFTSLLLLAILITTSKPLAVFVLGEASLQYLVILFAFTQVAMGINSSASAMLIANDDSLFVSKANFFTVLVMICLVLIGVEKYKSLEAVLVMLTLQPIFLLVILSVFARPTIANLLAIKSLVLPGNMIVYLLRFSLAVIIPVIFIQSNLIISRLMIRGAIDDHALGLWESVIKIDEGLLQLIALPLIYFFLPTVSEKGADHKAIRTSYIIAIFCLYGLAALTMLSIGGSLLSFLYSPEVSVMSQSLVILMVAGMSKTVFFVNQYVFLARNQVLLFITMEGLFYSLYLGSTWLALQSQEVEEIFKYYVVSSLIMSLVSFITMKRSTVTV